MSVMAGGAKVGKLYTDAAGVGSVADVRAVARAPREWRRRARRARGRDDTIKTTGEKGMQTQNRLQSPPRPACSKRMQNLRGSSANTCLRLLNKLLQGIYCS